MDKPGKSIKNFPPDNLSSDDECLASASKSRTRSRKRKRRDSESSTDIECILPENSLEFEKNLHNAALKNNLDDVSVKKILKKVVTNDHVLALVKIREEEEMALSKEQSPKPKLTRAKAKELMKVSPKSAPWNLELTPIKHIPVKTRPEVEALISKELPDDEDDDEYNPTQDDVPSDDDQTLESASDIDSQPATPGAPLTPQGLRSDSPRVLQDGPFKVPQISTPVRRKLVIAEEEEATIALRTRSKLSLSATPIEHIESSFVPPDDVPIPLGDSLWNQFLEECMNPADTNKNEDDDEADPEYSVAADPDAHDEDEDQLDGSILKISKKELNDLVTELFSIMPADVQLASNVVTETVPSTFEGKQEPISDEEKDKLAQSQVLVEQQRRDSTARFSIGKSEPEECSEDKENDDSNVAAVTTTVSSGGKDTKGVSIAVEEQSVSVRPAYAETEPPPLLRALRGQQDDTTTQQLTVSIDNNVQVLPEQLLLIKQQLRMHVQLAASNYLQLYVNPTHWHMAPPYKDYLTQLHKMVEANPNSVAGVCNLQPAVELVRSWEETVSQDTPENKEMIEFVQKEGERNRRRCANRNLYVGNFPEMFLKVVANSTVFLYPYLLPAMPYRVDHNRKFGYRLPEDELIVLGLDQFWQYVEDNPDLFKPPKTFRASRYGLVAACGLVVKHMMPWLTSKWLQYHVHRSRRAKDNPIARYLSTRHVSRVEHKLLPFNPGLTLYSQPAHEMPRLWVRYLAKTSKRFKYFQYKRSDVGVAPEGVPVSVAVAEPRKKPLPPAFTAPVVRPRRHAAPPPPPTPHQDSFDLVRLPHARPVLTVNPIGLNNHEQVITTEKHIQMEISLSEEIDETNPQPQLEHKNEVTIPNNKTRKKGRLVPVSIHKLTNPPNTIDSRNTVSSEANTVQNMFRMVQTSFGSYLVPVAVVQNTSTVNSITQPISSTVAENIQDTSKRKEISPPEDINGHCQCCVLLKKICKEKQSRITDFFSTKKTDEACECTYRKFPKITRRLRMLLDNFKSRSWCEQRRIRSMLDYVEKESDDKKKDKNAGETEELSLGDIEYVTTYHMKLTRRLATARDPTVNFRVNLILSNFDPDVGDPATLSEDLLQAFGEDLKDLHTEFMGFLNPEQADRIGRFKDYFVHSCIGDLVKKIETEILDTSELAAVLRALRDAFSVAAGCAVCCAALRPLARRPRLATHVFRLFPHRVARREQQCCEKQNPVDKSLPKPPTKEPSRCESPIETVPNQIETSVEQAAVVNGIPKLKRSRVIKDKPISKQTKLTKSLEVQKQASIEDASDEKTVDQSLVNDLPKRNRTRVTIDKSASKLLKPSSAIQKEVSTQDKMNEALDEETPPVKRLRRAASRRKETPVAKAKSTSKRSKQPSAVGQKQVSTEIDQVEPLNVPPSSENTLVVKVKSDLEEPVPSTAAEVERPISLNEKRNEATVDVASINTLPSYKISKEPEPSNLVEVVAQDKANAALLDKKVDKFAPNNVQPNRKEMSALKEPGPSTPLETLKEVSKQVKEDKTLLDKNMDLIVSKEILPSCEKAQVNKEHTVLKQLKAPLIPPVDAQKQIFAQNKKDEASVKESVDSIVPSNVLPSCKETLVVMEYDDSSGDDEEMTPQTTTKQSQHAEGTKNNAPLAKDKETVKRKKSTAKKIRSISESPVASPLLMSEDEQQITEIKTEPVEWTREEDTFILTILSERINLENKNALEILDGDKIHQIVVDKFPHKCIEHVKERVLRILEILVVNNY